MKREDLIKNIQIEIERLNRKIDLKIIKGLSYKKESKQHKFLLLQLIDLTRPKAAPQRTFQKRVPSGWFHKTVSVLGTFVF